MKPTVPGPAPPAGYVGKRRVLSYGWRDTSGAGTLTRTDEIPGFLLLLREKAASFVKVETTDSPRALAVDARRRGDRSAMREGEGPDQFLASASFRRAGA